ncbi:mannose-1-phosphate guanyltransferase [Francisella tularensis subsp. novicida GA99-3548]|uniref:mannose-1-phosphate guanylyltransferase/mannose-6-phosphate isomerase n=1 Tax=Francisella tularensis TaxID=263 RepID=UPI000158B3A7|nr:mannose-1-phosphate guanylyltransferase/mannose-6-phosphate isomerase [Francisella tularensis]AJI72962.1 mannose-1-phosphate guanylyltransferase/mannose-6-phosphate isomerase [Francisella tularensis subsp. novicida D9876]EDN38178.1 mannose-1-phosphate guanyltransferase [Francisella tularensis subsp. novicida GA99-3548]
MITPIILSGGSGSRLWPLSREASPKQFIGLVDEHSLLENTIKRLDNVKDITSPVVVCNESHRFQVAEVLRKINKKGDILLEPLAKNTAPAIALAALHLATNDPNTIMLVLAADHHIENLEVFHQAIEKAQQKVVKDDSLVTFGITPTCPHEGYGYIKQGVQTTVNGVYKVDKFVEKPSAVVAQEYLDSGKYYWNSGMFMFTARAYLEALEKLQPEIYRGCEKTYQKSQQDLDFVRFDRQSFATVQSQSIDYAVMEKATNVAIVPMEQSGWSDVGSWDSLYDIAAKDSCGNVVIGDVITSNVKNSYLRSHDRLLAAVGVNDLIIVETADAILVADKNKTQDVKKIVEVLKIQQRSELLQHKQIYKPWGSATILEDKSGYKIQAIQLEPGKKLSLQQHYHRSEHWIMISGTATVTIGTTKSIVRPNESVYIKIGESHRLENNGKIPVILIEVQVGEYISEDDIVRLDTSS